MRPSIARKPMLLLLLSCLSDPPAAPLASLPPAETDAPAICPASVADLPPAAGVDPADPRFKGQDLIVVLKGQRRLARYRGGALAGCWPVGLGFDPAGHKEREGDGRTPEGWYRSSDKPQSSFYAAIAVHYPNAADAAAGEAAGRIDAATRRSIDAALARDRKPPQATALGGEILLHGGGSASDWTLGCVALDDADIDALRATLPKGMAADILILP